MTVLAKNNRAGTQGRYVESFNLGQDRRALCQDTDAGGGLWSRRLDPDRMITELSVGLRAAACRNSQGLLSPRRRILIILTNTTGSADARWRPKPCFWPR